ncbi:MAG: hypothetical protein VYA51_12760 [Planctomycetota bacterium]|nr:hypothetical protein [Planctomycetota bacterium]
MSGELRDFDPDKVTVTWALPTGAIILHRGLIDGPGAIQDAKNKPRASRRTDRQGNQVRNKTRDRSGSLTLTYMADAQILAVLTGVIEGEDATGISAIGDIIVKNLNGAEIIRYAGAGIDDDPNIGYGDTAADRPYTWGYARRQAIATGLEPVG